MFEIPAALLSWFFGLTNSYIVAIALMSVVVMAITTPLTLKSTKGMLEMQKLSPEMRRLQNEHRNDKQKLNEEMMKLYQENKVNPMSSCLPIFAQMPVFIVMFRILRGWTYKPSSHDDVEPLANATFQATGASAEQFTGFIPRYMSVGSDLFQAIYQKTRIDEIGLDLGQSPAEAIIDNPATGVIYALLVVALGGLYFGQQRMVAARAAMSPTMSPTQQKVMQYLPVVFAVFQIFFLTALVIYYIFQTLLRILQQYYITKKFYGEDGLGRQAQRAGEEARAQAKENGEGGGFFDQMKRDLNAGRPDKDDDTTGKKSDAKKGDAKKPPPKGGRPTGQSKRVTPPKSRPTAGAKNGSGPGKGRPTPTRKQAEAARNRPKSSKSSKGSKGSKGSGKKKR